MKQSQHLYLGDLIDEQGARTETPLAYPLHHLTTHALLLGATGSGKTGLGLVLVEEILLQQIPVLLLDVKGDLTNLLLTFPDLAPEDFAPWVDMDVAQRQGQTPEEAATATATQWQEGLAAWNVDRERLAQLRRQAEIALLTPGMRSGRPVDILARFGASPQDDPDAPASRAQGLASALLGLAGIEADPLQSREHILLTNLIRHAWQEAISFDVATLIRLVQQPPFKRVGVFDLEQFFPQKDRLTLALTLNNLIAAPGFSAWREGVPLDIDSFLHAADGRPQATIFYLAHLPEEQRQFFVTLFLEELRSWIRRQPGTRTLRALLYFDEIHGYLPPHPYNPPTKAPLMALVKQGRAAGLGIVLATQNPADVDYKGLGNLGTWFVGALRTERDKKRVLEGMEGSLAESGMKSSEVEVLLSRLKPRLFLMHDARDGALHFFQSRWSMSYLRGPLTAAEVRTLVAAVQVPLPVADVDTPQDFYRAPFLPEPAALPVTPDLLEQPPTVTEPISQAFLPPTITASWAIRAYRERTERVVPANAPVLLIYQPYLLGVGITHLVDESAGVSLTDEQVWRVAAAEEDWAMRWDKGEMLALRIADLSGDSPVEGFFAPLPSLLGRKSQHAKWESAFKTHVYRRGALTLWRCTPLRLTSRPEESKPVFLEHCRRLIERKIARELDETQVDFERKAAKLQRQLRREELELEQDRDNLNERRREELLSGAETVLNLFSRRGRTRRALSQTSRQRRYVRNAKAGVEESLESLDMIQEQLDELVEAWEVQQQQITRKWRDALGQIRKVPVHPRRQDIEVPFCGLAWFPFWQVEVAGRRVNLPAYIPQSQP